MAMDPKNFTDRELADLMREMLSQVDTIMADLTERGYSVWFDTSRAGLSTGSLVRPLKVFIRKSIEL